MSQCSCGHNHPLRINSARKSPEPMALRLDPTRTTTLRQKMLTDVTRRFKALVQEINKIVIDDDCFGLVQMSHQLQFNAENQFKFARSADKVKGFMDWLQEMEKQKILTVVTKPGRIGNAVDEAWTDVYIDSAYQQGIRRAGQEMKKGGMDIPIPAGMPGRDPVALAFSSPTHADRVGLIYTRVFNELKGITNAMDQQISSILAQGLAEGRGPKQIAGFINDRVEKIGLVRARTLARTEIIRAHHMASIQEYRNAGLVGVSVKSEWLTAGFNVCPVCLKLAQGGDIGNGIYSLDKIEGMIPAHPSCRCAALPYMEGISPKPKKGN